MPDVLDTVKRWIGQLLEVGLLLIAIGIVVQILFGRTVAFLPGDIIGNIISAVDHLGDNGLVGLVAIGIILWLFWKRKLFSGS
jgi:hypothetical protein